MDTEDPLSVADELVWCPVIDSVAVVYRVPMADVFDTEPAVVRVPFCQGCDQVLPGLGLE